MKITVDSTQMGLSVQFYFNLDHPDLEDTHVQGYLVQQTLTPKSRWTDSQAGVKYEVVNFRGVQFDEHLAAIAEIQQETGGHESVHRQSHGRCCSGSQGEVGHGLPPVPPPFSSRDTDLYLS